MKILLVVLGVIAAIVLVIVLVGWMLPVRHHVARQATYPVSAQELFTIITKVEDFPRWRSKLQSAEVIASPGPRRFREVSSDGTIPYIVEEEVIGRRLKTRIDDRSLPFGGTWTYELTPAGTGTTLRITEDGEVYNPLFRFMSRFVFSHQATIEGYLKDLAKRVGVAVTITG